MNIERAINLVESIKKHRILFAGETIIDEYRYVTPMGKSPKENLVPVRWESTEVFMGGVEAAANHAWSFCETVDVLSTKAITRKVRFIDSSYMRKLFEFHHQEERVTQPVGERGLGGYNCVVVTDFGHGEFQKDDRMRLSGMPIYLAVNAQTNSANVGYNLITNWPRANYIVIDEPEARLAAQDRESPIEGVIEKLAEGRCRKFIVTQGTEGATGFDGTRFCKQKAFTKRVVDTMGAGDAFFAVTAPLAPLADLEDLLLIGNVAGALKCGIIGHRSPVVKRDVIDFLRGLA